MLKPLKVRPVTNPSTLLVLSLLVVILLTACGSRPSNSINIKPVPAQAASEPSTSSAQPPAANPAVSQSADANGPLGKSAAPAGESKKAPSADPAPAYSVQAPPPAQAESSSNAPAPAAPAAPTAAPAVAAPASNPLPQSNLEVKPEVGFQAPDFSLETLDGQTIRLSDLRGRPVIISYWASWCAPCKEELPILNNLSQEYASSGIRVITIDAIEQDTEDKVRAIVDQLGLSLPVLLDRQNQFNGSYGQLFFPTSYFVDASGTVRFIKLGSISADELRIQVDRLVANHFE